MADDLPTKITKLLDLYDQKAKLEVKIQRLREEVEEQARQAA